MRLLYRATSGSLAFTDDIVRKSGRQPYAILSHTWHANPSEEVIYWDIIQGTYELKRGYQKITFCLQQAAKDGLKYVWVDTCCLDHGRPAELSEAINGMFSWYADARKCYVYMQDVSSNQHWLTEFSQSRWHTRTWCLPELLAPREVQFYSREGFKVGDKRSLEPQICDTTGIPLQALRGKPLWHFSVAERLAWAERRQCSREEDQAYALFGVFGISMLPFYGEGVGAWSRLMKELKGLPSDQGQDTASTANEGAPADGGASRTTVNDAQPWIRFVPHVETGSSRSTLPLDVISKTLTRPDTVVRVGRYSERNIAITQSDILHVGFKSKVVSRRHCDFWCTSGQWYVKDQKSSAGTFLNNVRLSGPNEESPAYPINDGDIVQLGIDFEGGEEIIFRCVKFHIVCNRGSDAAQGGDHDTHLDHGLVGTVDEARDAALGGDENTDSDRDLTDTVEEARDAALSGDEDIHPEGGHVDTHDNSGLDIGLDDTVDEARDTDVDGDDDSDHVSVSGDSIFSVDSIGSTNTEMSVLLEKLPAGTLDRFIDHIFCTRELLRVNLAAAADFQSRESRLRRNLRRLVRAFGKNLGQELDCTDELQRNVVRMLSSRSMSSHLVGGILGRSRSAQPAKKILDFEFSRQIFERHSVDREEAVPAQDSDDDTSDSSSEDGEDEPPLSKEQIECVESLLVGSHSYALYKQQLVDFVHQTYEKRVHKALGDCLVSSDGSRLDQTGTAAIAYELSWVPTGLVAFASTFPISTRDRLIGSIERAMGEQWGWWPLADPKRTGPPAFSRLTWPYLCGAYEYIDVPVKTADALREVLRNAPLFMEDPLLHDSTASTKIPTLAAASGSAAHATKAASSTTQTSTTSKAATGAQSSSTPQQVSSSTSQTKPGTPNKQATATTAQPPINLRYVYFCTETGLSGGTFKYSVIKTHLLEHDPQFFQQLKKEYIDSRGSVREWFSWWRYDHCEFYQFQKFASELSEPVVVGFPSETDPDYDFQPSPLKPHSRPPYGPILKSEYRHRFYTSCTSCHSWHILHQQRKNAYNQADTSRIRVLPKRKQEVDMTDSESEVFWGIIARERRGFAWVLAYGCLANAPGVVFFFLWLFSWGHASDLQNAAIPLTISMCLTLTFATVLYEDRRGDARVR